MFYQHFRAGRKKKFEQLFGAKPSLGVCVLEINNEMKGF